MTFCFQLVAPLMAVTACVACSGGLAPQTAPASDTVEEIQVDPRSSCIDLTERGLLRGETSELLIAKALRDAEADGRRLSFYKSVSSSKVELRYLIFSVAGTTDLYRVYLIEDSKERLVSKFNLGSLHYPPDRATCRFPGID